jgi:hypothetical protein
MAMQIPQVPTFYGGGAAPYSVESGGIRIPSSFGLGADRTWSARAFVDSPRCRMLGYNRAFFACSQHDLKVWDCNGAAMLPGPAFLRNGLMTAVSPVIHIPHALRRPVAPVRLLRTIVKRFTAMLFGKGRWPSFKVKGDPKSQDFVGALVKAERLHAVMTRARNMGGASGSVGLSWRFFEGKPRVLAHDAATLDVQSWQDRELCIPEHVTQCYRMLRTEYDPKTKQVGPVVYWFRRDWTSLADVAFFPVRDDAGEPTWIVDEENTVEHGDGFCHFVWIQNAPPDDEQGFDGLPDYQGSDERSQALDALNSVCVMGGLKNLDPTLLLKVDIRQAQSGMVRKGSDNALLVGESGNASYMELAGTAITAGLELAKSQRKGILEEAECVIPDPDELTAAGMSSVAIAELYSPMTGQTDVLRVQYGDAMERLIDQQVASYRRQVDTRDPETGEQAQLVEVDDDGQEIEVENVLDLPPDVEEVEQPDGSVQIVVTSHELGPTERVRVEVEWPPYFEQSASEVQAEAGAMVSANGGKPVLSQRTSVERFARAIGVDTTEEWKRVQMQNDQQKAQEGGMFPGTGGQVDDGQADAPRNPGSGDQPDETQAEDAPTG